MRDPRVYLEDMLEGIRRIRSYAHGRSFEDFERDELVVDGIVRNLEVLGEAAKQTPDELKKTHPEVDWRKIAGLRDVLIHQYFGIDLVIVWDIVQNKLPALEFEVRRILQELPQSDRG